jgi:hypothetical protein
VLVGIGGVHAAEDDGREGRHFQRRGGEGAVGELAAVEARVEGVPDITVGRGGGGFEAQAHFPRGSGEAVHGVLQRSGGDALEIGGGGEGPLAAGHDVVHKLELRGVEAGEEHEHGVGRKGFAQRGEAGDVGRQNRAEAHAAHLADVVVNAREFGAGEGPGRRVVQQGLEVAAVAGNLLVREQARPGRRQPFAFLERHAHGLRDEEKADRHEQQAEGFGAFGGGGHSQSWIQKNLYWRPAEKLRSS